MARWQAVHPEPACVWSITRFTVSASPTAIELQISDSVTRRQ